MHECLMYISYMLKIKCKKLPNFNLKCHILLNLDKCNEEVHGMIMVYVCKKLSGDPSKAL